jgi:hypothetical protein
VSGFRPKRTPFKLDFSGTECEGLEVTVRPVPMSVMLDVGAASAVADSQAFRQVVATFAYALESWNLEGDDGAPVPAGLDGLMSQDPQFVGAVIQAWVTAMAGGAVQ